MCKIQITEQALLDSSKGNIIERSIQTRIVAFYYNNKASCSNTKVSCMIYSDNDDKSLLLFLQSLNQKVSHFIHLFDSLLHTVAATCKISPLIMSPLNISSAA